MQWKNKVQHLSVLRIQFHYLLAKLFYLDFLSFQGFKLATDIAWITILGPISEKVSKITDEALAPTSR